jgi:hypothetical protein
MDPIRWKNIALAGIPYVTKEKILHSQVSPMFPKEKYCTRRYPLCSQRKDIALACVPYVTKGKILHSQVSSMFPKEKYCTRRYPLCSQRKNIALAGIPYVPKGKCTVHTESCHQWDFLLTKLFVPSVNHEQCVQLPL